MSDEDLLPEGEGVGQEIAPQVEEQPSTEEATQVEEAPTMEDVASEMGWAPQDEWRGDPDKWKPAHEFVRKTGDINTRLNTRMKRLEDTLSRINRTNEVMTERALSEQRQKLLDQRNEAFETGDKEAFDKADKGLEQLPSAPVQEIPPETRAFVEKHASWWGKDTEATAWAQGRADQLSRQGLSPSRQLAAIDREIKEHFPEYSPKSTPKPKPAPLTQPGKRGAIKREKGFSDMPPEAQKEAEYWEGKGVKKEDFVKTYFEQEGVQ